MGKEYLLRFTFQNHARPALDTLLRETPYFSDYDSDYHLYNFRTQPPLELPQMPDLYAAIEHEGLYVCEFGEDAAVVETVINYLEAALRTQFGEVTLEDLE